MKDSEWWRRPEFWERIFKSSMWLLLGLVIIMCQQVISTSGGSTSRILSDSSQLVRGKVGDRIRIDTSDVVWKTAVKNSEGNTGDKLNQLYTNNNFKTYWLGDKAPTDYYFKLVEIFGKADNLGLQSSRYSLRGVEQKMRDVYEGDRSIPVIVDLDIEITKTFFQFARHLSDGRIQDTGFGKNLWKKNAIPDVYKDVMYLSEVKNPDDLHEVVEKLKPDFEQYQKLEQAYQYYVALEKKYGSLKPIVIDRKIKPAERHSSIPQIRRRLALHHPDGNTPDSSKVHDSLVYDTHLAERIRAFQIRHGLTTDAVIGGKTITYLNRSFGSIAMILALNMERLRWQHKSHNENYITVNIPEFTLRVYDKEHETFRTNVVVGDPETPTPVFTDKLEHIVFAPTWTIPKSIIEEEIIPRLQEDPDYYSERNYTFMRRDSKEEIDPLDESWEKDVDPGDYLIVQQPGDDNALGKVKFVMPNNLSIYLHDTPQKRLFKKNYRAFSHGCIRVENPHKLAEHLLRDNNRWNAQSINEAMGETEPKTVMLKKHYVVHLQYQTAWVDENGLTHFRDDIYGHDKHQIQQLYSKPSV